MAAAEVAAAAALSCVTHPSFGVWRGHSLATSGNPEVEWLRFRTIPRLALPLHPKASVRSAYTAKAGNV